MSTPLQPDLSHNDTDTNQTNTDNQNVTTQQTNTDTNQTNTDNQNVTTQQTNTDNKTNEAKMNNVCISFKPCGIKVEKFKSNENYQYKQNIRYVCGSHISKNFRPKGNGFVKSLINAYNHHHKLILRPDDVWIAIMTQF
jgi:hypothetical protein